MNNIPDIVLVTVRSFRPNSCDLRLQCDNPEVLKNLCHGFPEGQKYQYQKFEEGRVYTTIKVPVKGDAVSVFATEYIQYHIIRRSKELCIIPRVVVEVDNENLYAPFEAEIKSFLVPRTKKPVEDPQSEAAKLPF